MRRRDPRKSTEVLQRLDEKIARINRRLAEREDLYWHYHRALHEACERCGKDLADVEHVEAARLARKIPRIALAEASKSTARRFRLGRRTIERRISAWQKDRARSSQQIEQLQRSIATELEPKTEADRLLQLLPPEQKLEMLTDLRKMGNVAMLRWVVRESQRSDELWRDAQRKLQRMIELEAKQGEVRDEQLRRAAAAVRIRPRR